MDGAEALQKVAMELPDLVITDIKMPGMDVFETCRRLRQWSQIPIIMLSARGDETDKVKYLDLGADDYITKPFGASKLVVRVRAVLRRTGATGTILSQPFFTSGDLQIDFAKRRVTIAGIEVRLTPTEYSLLQEFALNAGKVLTSRRWISIYRHDVSQKSNSKWS
jgi:two-component system KDP operon response regulator KdpE